ncbi:MAG: GlsB/YeaQ/YmgE family stress response membrane protein [Thermoleophilia bacterium]|nr:GlsB/YeaQ/YmgE family stress response membrane protein [Thermoleophilia bacterium]
MLGAVLSLLVSGLIIGLLARFAVPGKDPLKLWQTILLGIAGSLLGGFLAALLGVIDGDDTITGGEAAASFLFSLGGAIVLLILYRVYVQKRPLTGPNV